LQQTKFTNTCIMKKAILISFITASLFFNFSLAQTIPGKVWSQYLLDEENSSFGLHASSFFGTSVASIGDFDSDGVGDFIVGAEGYNNTGAVWLVLMNNDFTVKSKTLTSNSLALNVGDYFGSSLAAAGDFDGDGITDIIVGARGDSSEGNSFGAIYILCLNGDGSIKTTTKISSASNGFLADDFGANVNFGTGVAYLGNNTIAVGANGYDNFKGSVWVFTVNDQGDVLEKNRIGVDAIAELADFDAFGSSVAAIKNEDTDGNFSLVVGAPLNEDGSDNGTGAIYLIEINEDLVVQSYVKISKDHPLLSDKLLDFDQFGNAVSVPGDIDKNGFTDIVVGAYQSDDGGNSSGAVFVLLMNESDLAGVQKISNTDGDFGYTIPDESQFGSSLAVLSDMNNNGVPGFIAGLQNFQSTAQNQGALMLVNLHGNATTDSVTDNQGVLVKAWATINPHGIETEVFFEYGLSNAYGITSDTLLVDGEADLSVAIDLTNLTPDSQYYFRVKVQNARGFTYGQELTFTTSGSLFAGSGMSDDPFLINNLNDLQTLSENFAYWNHYFIQTDSIDASETATWEKGAGLSPIGNEEHPFKGDYNGQGHAIAGLTINRPDENYVGLFGKTQNANLLRIGLLDANIAGHSNVGALAGALNNSTISNCFATGNIAGMSESGGFAGSVDSSNIENCYTLADITRRSGSEDGMNGGFVGYNSEGTIKHCYSTGRLIYEGADNPTTKGFVGKDNSGIYSGNFWDMETSEQTSAGDNDGEYATGKTTTEMKLLKTYTGDVGDTWDFISTWAMAKENNLTSYPYLENNQQIPAPGLVNAFSVSFSAVNEHGTVSAITGTTTIESGIYLAQGSAIEFTAHPADNYFVIWELNGELLVGGNPIHVYFADLSEDITVTSEFFPIVVTWPTAMLTHGEQLSDAVIAGGETGLPGSFIFENPDQMPEPGTYDDIPVLFVPDDSQNYGPVYGTITVVVDFSDDVEELQTARINVYPNPARDRIHVYSEWNINRIIIRDISGKIIYSESPGQTEYNIHLSGFESGTYIMHFYTEMGVIVKKIVVDR